MDPEIELETAGAMLPPPPLQTWEDAEAGAPGQLNLPGLTEWPTVAERAFIRLVDHYHDALVHLDEAVCWVPEPIRETGYACLLLAVEHGEQFTAVARRRPRDRRESGMNWLHARPGSGGWIEDLTWRLIDQAGRGSAVADLTFQLAAPGSDFRMACMELAQRRLAHADQRGPGTARYLFHSLELRVRRQIEAAVFRDRLVAPTAARACSSPSPTAPLRTVRVVNSQS